jgi:hypothetical protein
MSRSWWREGKISNSELRRDFNPARARRIRAISQQIMRPRISGNGWEAHHFQTGWGFCQRQAGELLTEVGLKRHYKTPEPIKLLRIAPKR